MNNIITKMLVCALAFTSVFAVVTDVNAASSSDGVTVTATVQEDISLNCDAATVNLGTIISGNVVTGSSTCTVTTNSSAGYTVSVESDNDNSTAGLYSTATTEELEALASSSVAGGSDGFGIYVSATDADSIDEAFDHDGNADVAVSTTGATAVSKASAAASGDDTTFNYRAAAASSTASGSYSSVVTYTGITQ